MAPVIEIDHQTYEVRKDGIEVEVTPTEFKILNLLKTNGRKVTTRQEFLKKVWGRKSIPIDIRNVDSYISRLRAQLGRDAIKTVIGIGYKFIAG